MKKNTRAVLYKDFIRGEVRLLLGKCRYIIEFILKLKMVLRVQ